MLEKEDVKKIIRKKKHIYCTVKNLRIRGQVTCICTYYLANLGMLYKTIKLKT